MTRKQAITMDEVAELANVSKPTVSRALSNSPLVNAKTREHVLEVARKHGYTVNRNAQKLRHKHTDTIAVSIDFLSHRENHISDPFIFELLAGVSEALGGLNKDLLLTAPNHNDADDFLQMLSSRGADGFIFLGQGHREQMLTKLASHAAPMVVWGAKRKNVSYCVVGSDNFLGGQLAGRYFLEQGRRHFLFVGDPAHAEIGARRDGFEQAVKAGSTAVKFSEILLSNFSYDSALDTASQYVRSNGNAPDAVFTQNDTAAMAFVRAFADIGLRVPEDVSIVGYNDIPSAEFFSPPITTIRQDTYQAGALLVDKLMKLIEGKRTKSETIKTELIVRGT